MQRAVIAALGTLLLAGVAAAPISAAAAEKAPAKAATAPYKAPRNAFNQPDLSGFWSNATLTPMARRPQFKDQLNYTPEQVKEMESSAAAEVEEGNEDTDPNAPAEAPKTPPGANVRPEFAAAGGDVGGYNRGWLDPGSHVMRVNGEPRTSLITTPNGQPPARKAGAPPAPRFGGGMGAFESYESRSLGERCILSFGRNAGPPMFPNGFYNNNYQIVQTGDSVLIEVEMIHDLRIVRLNSKHRADNVRPYMGDSIGWWEGETLVVETTHIRRQEPPPLRLHRRRPDDLGQALGRRVRVLPDGRRRDLRIRLPRGQLRPARHPGRRPRGGSCQGRSRQGQARRGGRLQPVTLIL